MGSAHTLRRRAVLVLEAFIVLTAVPAGLLLVFRPDGSLLRFPPGLLDGSPFRTYLVPGLALAFLVGGGSAMAGLAVWRGHALASPLARGSGLVILGWIALQVLFIGYQGALQPLIFLIGAALCLLPAGTSREESPHRKRVTTKK